MYTKDVIKSKEVISIQKTSPDYALKSKVLNSDWCKIEKSISRLKFQANYNDDIWQMVETLENQYYNNPNDALMYCEAKKINHASYQRANRLKQRISKIIQKDSLFLTFTFRDEVLQKTTSDTRKQYVRRFLNAFNVPYVANIDFGSKNGREHYHAILQMPRINLTEWKYGGLNGKIIRNTNDDVKLAKYISKLTNHAIKETTKRQAIIYSRE